MGLFDLTGKKAVVTGGGKGLGRGMAEALHGAGAEVVLVGSSESAVSAARQMSASGAPVHAVQADLRNRHKLASAFNQCMDKLGGGLDILVNNAGVTLRARSEEYPLEAWDQLIELNLTSVFVLCQLAGRVMLAQGSGKIINVSSLLAFFGGILVPAYAASKGGVAQLTKALSNEWAGKGVNVNAIAPGYMHTDLTEPLVKDPVRNAEILSRIPAGRWGTADDLKGVVLFLASSASDYVSGAVIPVDGGYTGR